MTFLRNVGTLLQIERSDENTIYDAKRLLGRRFDDSQVGLGRRMCRCSSCDSGRTFAGGSTDLTDPEVSLRESCRRAVAIASSLCSCATTLAASSNDSKALLQAFGAFAVGAGGHIVLAVRGCERPCDRPSKIPRY